MAGLMDNKKLFPFMRRGRASDCNNTMQAGLYHLDASSLNSPFVGANGELIVTDHYGDSSWVIQIAMRSRGTALYFRSTGGKSFDDVPWQKLQGTVVQ